MAQKLNRLRLMTAAGLLCSAVTLTGSAEPRVVHEASSDFYDRIFVVDEGDLRGLHFDSADGDRQTQIRIGHPEELPMPYLRSAAVGLAVPASLERLLMIGLGGGAFANFVRERLPAVTINAVEIDPVVVAIARDYFAVRPDDRLAVHIADAVEYVQQRHEPYDFILLDAYDADDLPEALTTHAFFEDVRQLLDADGIVVANIAISSTRRTRDFISKIAGHFHYCMHLDSPPRYNDILLLSLAPLPDVAELTERAERFDQASAPMHNLRRYAETARPCFGPQ